MLPRGNLRNWDCCGGPHPSGYTLDMSPSKDKLEIIYLNFRVLHLYMNPPAPLQAVCSCFCAPPLLSFSINSSLICTWGSAWLGSHRQCPLWPSRTISSIHAYAIYRYLLEMLSNLNEDMVQLSDII